MPQASLGKQGVSFHEICWLPSLFRLMVTVAIIAPHAIAAETAPVASPCKPVNFSRDVLPILSDHCFNCHGPDAKSRQADLRLDRQETVLDVVVKPRDLEHSLLWERVVSSDTDDMMPPQEIKRRLTPEQIQTLKTWIEEGAPWGRHWAFEPIQQPAVPSRGETLQPIDAFVAERLQGAGLDFAPQADNARLLRRLSMDLTGLPPSPELRKRYLKDSAQLLDVGGVVDDLLASPHYGERMAWEWLEAGRYADTNGYQGDNERTMWPWRDWVVEAFNLNVPFDRFTREQLAGDLLPSANPEQKLATAFLRNHMINGEGGRIAAENRVDYVMDMTETTGTVWLGLTMNCCRCHDHKFDPIKQRDYYQLFGFFNNTPVEGGGGDPQTAPVLEWPNDSQKQRREQARKLRESAAADVTRWEEEHVPLNALAPAEGQPFSTRAVSVLPALEDPNGRATSAWQPADGLPAEIRSLRQKPPAERKPDELDKLIAFWNQWSDGAPQSLLMLKSRAAEVESIRREIPRVMVMEDRAAAPRDNFILAKGLYNQPGEPAGTDVPEFLKSASLLGKQPSTSTPVDRRFLADWLLENDNPLVARVIVNRVWQQFFGVGLVKTSEDFGIQGEKPSHPELLDWLAADFRAHGWDVKRLVRQIVTSRTYLQTSLVPPEAYARDPENRLLARGPRYRWPSWMLRDQALAASGLLVPKLGGPPVKPYQPEGVWEEATFGAKKYQPDQGEALYRRSLYTFWRRIVAPTMFFDTASRQTCTVRTSRTNTPLQALALMNDITYLEAARTLATRIVLNEAAGTEQERLRSLFEQILVRPPTPEELDSLGESLGRWREKMAAAPSQVKELLAAGASPPSLAHADEAARTEAAAWTAVAMILLNLDETLTKE